MTSLAKIDWRTKLFEAIPLLVGVVITRRCNLHGWRAIIVYVLAAGATRQLIQALESEVNLSALIAGLATTPADYNGHGQPTLDAPPPPLFEEAHQVVHAIPGRLRVSITLADKPDYARYLQQQLERDQPHLQSVRVNPHAASVTIKYDIEKFTETEIRAYLSELIKLALETFSENRLSEV